MDDRKQLSALCVMVIIGALVCYLLGLGPACWLSSRFGGEKFVTIAYRPLTFAVEVTGREGLMDAIQWWSVVGTTDFHHWSFSRDAPGHAEWAPLFFELALERLILGEDDTQTVFPPF
jgi:hypothetical protein